MNSGKLITVFMLIVGGLAASAAWWHNSQKGKRALEFLTGDVAHQIRTSEKVELCRLTLTADPSSELQTIQAGDGVYQVIANDISQSRGLVHARQALISDPSYDWETSARSKDAKWQLALRFTPAKPQMEKFGTTILLDLENGYLANAARPEEVVRITIAEGLKKFVNTSVPKQDSPSEN